MTHRAPTADQQRALDGIARVAFDVSRAAASLRSTAAARDALVLRSIDRYIDEQGDPSLPRTAPTPKQLALAAQLSRNTIHERISKRAAERAAGGADSEA